MDELFTANPWLIHVRDRRLFPNQIREGNKLLRAMELGQDVRGRINYRPDIAQVAIALSLVEFFRKLHANDHRGK